MIATVVTKPMATLDRVPTLDAVARPAHLAARGVTFAYADGTVALRSLDLAIPRGQVTLLAEHGTALRLLGLTMPLELTRSYPMTLHFAKAGALVEFVVLQGVDQVESDEPEDDGEREQEDLHPLQPGHGGAADGEPGADGSKGEGEAEEDMGEIGESFRERIEADDGKSDGGEPETHRIDEPRRGDEAGVLALSAALESIRPWAQRWPDL